MPTFEINNQLNIKPGPKGGIVFIPGCEPTSVLSSPRLNSAIRDSCPCPFVYVEDVLEAIPGTTIKLISNSEISDGSRVLVLPPYNTDCPCENTVDYYSILKELCQPEEECEDLGDCSFNCHPTTEADQWAPINDKGCPTSPYGRNTAADQWCQTPGPNAECASIRSRVRSCPPEVPSPTPEANSWRGGLGNQSAACSKIQPNQRGCG